MISHRITIFNEPPPKVYTPPTVFVSEPKPHLFVGQLTYDAWVKQCGFAVGDFVTLVSASIHMSHMAAVHRITRIEPEFEKLTWSSHGREWKPFYMVGCNLYDKPSVAPWSRWDSISGYRHLTQHEHNAIIAPVYDQLQNYCTKHG